MEEEFAAYKLDRLRPTAEIIKRYYNGRKVVFWGDSPEFRYLLETEYRIIPESYTMTNLHSKVTSDKRFIGDFENRRGEYYIVVPFLKYESDYKGKLEKFGYKEFRDFVFRYHEPITIVPNSPDYSDEYGNVVKSCKCKVLIAAETGNAKVNIAPDAVFGEESFVYLLQNNRMEVTIGKNCIFKGKFSCFVLGNGQVRIGNQCTFDDNFHIVVNNKNRIIIGNQCIFSQNVHLHSGYGHSMFDTETGQKINTFIHNDPKNIIEIGDFVRIGYGCSILNRTVIGNSSAVNAGAVGKGIFPDNVLIAGNPMRVIKSDLTKNR